MNRLIVPQQKDQGFSNALFNVLSDGLNELRLETGKWPDSIIISGPLGMEVHSFILDQGWDLSAFGLKYLSSPVNKIRLEYSKPLDQIRDVGKTLFDKPIGDTEIKGIPGRETIDSIMKTYLNFSYTIQRTVRPAYEIPLIKS